MPLHPLSPCTRPAKRQHYALALSALFTLAAAPAMSADNPGAHEHGHAVLQMAVENNHIDLILTSPAFNLAGFEHEARTDEEKARLTEIQRWLETTALVNTGSAGCRVTAAAVALGGDMEEDHDDHHDDHGHEEEKHGEPTHREYEVSQQLMCESVGASQTFTSALMDRFQNLEELTVEWVTPSGQGSARLSASSRKFTIKN